jgi:outer membrane receptor protein involved in Fe transport
MRLLPVLRFWLLAALTGGIGAAPADGSRDFRVPPADAARALEAFAAQSGAALVYVVDHVRGVPVPGVTGRHTPRAALDRLLAGTALVASEDPVTGALMIKRAPPPTATVPSPNEPPTSSSPLKPKSPSRSSGWLAALLAAMAAPLADAQTAPAAPATDPAKDSTITLAAFEVTSDRDVGYTASSALAGGRIETPLKDTPSAISILTAEFLDDIAATSFSSAAEWAPNSIPVGDTATFGEYNTNMRGVGNSFPSRNYFRWYVSSDNYNTERLEFARGPNSILFGDGNPGGVNTTWTKQALFVPKRSIQLRTDTYGGYRASFDYNVPASDKIAFRINGLHDRLKGWKDYDEPLRDSFHLAATVRLTKDTQVRGEYEDGRYRRFSFAQTFADQSSNWNRVASYNGLTAPPTAGTGVARLNSGINDDYLLYLPSMGSGTLLNLRGYYQSTGTGLRILPEGRPQIARYPVLPGREFSLQPPDGYIDTNYHTWTFYLEHRLPAGIIAQLAFNHQDQRREGKVRTYDQHRIDVNTVLPGGAPNPNFGQAFVDVHPQITSQVNKLSDWRLSLAYKKQLRWVRQSLSFVSGLRKDDFNNYMWQVGRVNGPNRNALAATNLVRIRQYWNGPRNPAAFDSLFLAGSDVRFVNNNAADEDQSLQYNQLASSSSLFDGKLSVLLGYRYDTHDRKQQRRVAANPDGTSVMGATGGPGTVDLSNVSVGTSSAGAVYFPVPWLGVYANYSESFNAAGSGAAQIDGSPIGPSSNEGIDVGLKLEFFGGKLAGSIGYYDMQQTERPRTGDRQADINEIWTDLGRPEENILAFRDLESYKGNGLEIDLTANLTRSWRLMFNYSVPKTQQADIGPGLRGYVAQHLATWQAGAANPALPNAARIAQNIIDINNTIGGYTQGRTLNGTVDYTANLYTTYSFREGVLKGFALGGGANFRGKQVVGNANGSPFDYRYAEAYTLVSAHTSYDLRLGKARVRLQLNASNLLDEDAVVYTSYAFNAAAGGNVPNAFRYHSPRKISLTATFTF